MAAVLLVAAFVSAVPYLLVGDGAATPLSLPRADSAHVALGAVLVVVVVAKGLRLGARTAVPMFPGVVVWQRRLSFALALTTAATVATGAAALVHLPSPASDAICQAHLLSATWATGLALWHVAAHSRRLGRAGIRRCLAAAALPLCACAAIGAVWPAAVSPLARAGADTKWEATGPQVFLDALALVPGGRHRSVLAGGAGLFVERTGAGDGDSRRRHWTLVGPFDARDLVFTIDVDAAPGLGGGTRVLVGAANGLFGAAGAEGPYRALTRGVSDVHATVIAANGAMWCSSTAGMLRSDDDGATWQNESAGLAMPSSAWALARAGGELLGSDATGVYRWDLTRWVRETNQRAVVSLDAVGPSAVVASSMGQGLWRRDHGSWREVSDGLPHHAHGGAVGVHVVSVTAMSGRREVAGTMVDGAAESADGGRTWLAAWPGLAARGVVWRILPVGHALLAVTDNGLARAVEDDRSAPPWWWWPCTAIVVWLSASGAVVGSDSRRGARRRGR